MSASNSKVTSFFSRIPHAITMLFGIIVLVSVLTYILPAGTYDRIVVDGRNTVVPNSYKTIPSTPIGFLDMFRAIPLGFKAAVEIIFIVLSGGIMFGFMEKSKAFENAVGTLVKRLGLKKR
ncbi:MAG: YfcC family protein, partial [Bacteroidota bacterium]